MRCTATAVCISIMLLIVLPVSTQALNPPNPVKIGMLHPRLTTTNYIGIGWTKNMDTDFESYRIYRATHPNVTPADTLVVTITNQNQVYFKDVALSPGTYFYKVFVFNQAGLASPSDEVWGRIFAPEEVKTRISVIPEPGDFQFPPDVAIPRTTIPLSTFDCTRDPFLLFNCLDTSRRVSPNVNAFGYQISIRIFDVTLNNLQMNNELNLKFLVFNIEIVTLRFTAQDRDYQIFIPTLGVFKSIPQGQTGSVQFQAYTGGLADTFDVVVKTNTETNPTAGTFHLAPSPLYSQQNPPTPLPKSTTNDIQPIISTIIPIPARNVDTASIFLKLDGNVVSHSYDSINQVVSYTPLAPLATSSHFVDLFAQDICKFRMSSPFFYRKIRVKNPISFCDSPQRH